MTRRLNRGWWAALTCGVVVLSGCEADTPSPLPSAGIASARPADAADWPQWRGPQRDGHSAETNLLLDWSEQQPTRLWLRPLGAGFSSMAVVDDRLFTMAQVDGEEYVFCLNADDGETVWKTRSGGEYLDPQGGDGPRGTPTVDGRHVYTLGANGDLMCLVADSGDVVWQRNILQDFGAENLRWGVSQSPLVDGDKLVVGVGGKGASVVAFDKSTGKVIWKALDYVAGYASPVKISVASQDGEAVPLYVLFCGKALIGVSPEDGSQHWQFEWVTTDDMNIATPLYDPQTQLLFVSAARNTGRCSAYRLTADNGQVSAEEVYTNTEMRNHYNSCVLVDGYVYGYDNSTLKCLELTTGDVMWEDRSVGKGGLISAAGHLFVLGERGDLAVVEATPEEYREKGRIQALDSTRAWTEPALAAGRLYVRDLENIACLDIVKQAEGHR